MMAADQSILQVLGPPRRFELTTNNVAKNAGLSRQYASERLRVLAEKNLVHREKSEGSDPFYSITEKGERVLEGNIDPDDL